MALSFSEKRALQKTVSTNLAALAAGNVSFTDKRRLQKEITEAMAKLNAKVEAAPTYSDWERAVTDIIAAKLGIPNGDAQGIVEVQSFTMQQAWGQGLDAQAAAEKVLAAGAPAVPVNQSLADLQAGRFNGLEPLAFLGKLKEIHGEIGDIEPLKQPAIAYIEANMEKVGAVMESALQEAFGKLWSASAGV